MNFVQKKDNFFLPCFFWVAEFLSDPISFQLCRPMANPVTANLNSCEKLYNNPDYNNLGTNFEFKKENLAWALPCFFFGFLSDPISFQLR